MSKKVFFIALALAFFLTVAPNVPSDKKTIKAAPADIVLSSDVLTDSAAGIHTLIYKNGNYRYYPQTFTYTNKDGVVTTAQFRDTCKFDKDLDGVNDYREQPWPAHYPITGSPSPDQANNFNTDLGEECAVREMNASSGYWMVPEALAGWAIPSDVSFAVDNADWIVPLPTFNTEMASTRISAPDADHPKPIWRTTTRTTYDSETDIHGDNKYEQKLLSAGTGYFRTEFNVSQDQYDFIQAHPGDVNFSIKSQADDFQKAFLNGYSEEGMEKATTRTTGENEFLEKTFTGDQLLDPNGVALRVGQNVLAFQVNDKAIWTDLTSSPSNAAGLAFTAGLAFSEPAPTPTLSCTVTPQTGLAPLTVSVTTQTNIADPIYNYDMDNDGTFEYINRTTPIYYTYQNDGTYTVKVVETSSEPDVTTTCPATVKPPTDSDGGEVTP